MLLRFASKLRVALHARAGRGLACLCCPLVIFGFVSSAPAQHRFASWTTENGLPQNSVNAIVQTHDGYLWAGTLGGLARFDGVQFTVFDAGNAEGIKGNRIQALYEGRDGSLWIGTEDGGLTRFKDGTFTTYDMSDGLPSNFVASICEDREGALWLGTLEGLVRFRDGKFTAYTEKDGLPHRNVKAVRPDREGNLWVGMWDGGLARLRDGQLTSVLTRPDKFSKQVSAIYEARDGSLWVGTVGGLFRFKDEALTAYTTADGLSSNFINHITEDRAGHLWVGTEKGGIARFKDETFTAYTTQDGLADDQVNCAIEDREGNLWIGTDSGGLTRFKEKKLTFYGVENGLPHEAVVPITEDLAGNIWIGATCGGLVRFGDGRLTTYNATDGLPKECVWSLCAGRDGSLWVGTWGGGLSHFEGGAFTTYTDSNSGLSSNVVLAIYQDREGTLWLGTDKGLNRFRDGKFTAYRATDGLVHDDVRFITQDRAGALLVGTLRGFSRFKDGVFTNHTTAEGLSHHFVRAIHEDVDGALWLGTYGGGLSRLKDGKFTHFNTKNGLFDDVVSRILEDAQGRFWMSGNRGIFRASRRELNDFADGKTQSFNTVSYGVADGMKTNECNGGAQPAGWQTRDGRLWFPTIKGAVMIDPQQAGTNELPPPVHVERALIDNSPVKVAGKIEMLPGKSNLEIHYTGLSFVAPDKVRFRYRLLGLDDEWVEAGTRRVVHYSHLPPGTYDFNVIAANDDGVWNTAGAIIQIVVVPPFWKTWWFLSAAVVVCLAIVFLMHKRHVLKLKREHAAQAEFSRQLIESQERERKRIAAELHDSLGQNLLVIKNRALVGLNARADHERVVEQLDHISATTSQAIVEVREIAYNLRPYQLDRLGLTKTIQSMLKKVADASGLNFAVALDNIDGLFPEESEISLYRIVQEAVNNIVKHAGATEVEVTINKGPHGIDLTIKDNGKGFIPGTPPSESTSGGFGLTGIAERAKMIGGSYAINSVPGQGTTVYIKL